MFLSAAMMLEWLGGRGAGEAWNEAATDLRRAVDTAFAMGLRTAEFGGAGTRDVTRAILNA